MTSPFPRFVLARAFLKPLLGRILLCGAVLTALLEVLALLEEASDILGRHLGVRGLIKFLALHMPAMATEIMPLSVMIGALFTLLQMALSNEITILRSSGLSSLDMYKHFLPAPIIVGFLTIIVQFWVVPPCEQALNKWWNVTDTAHDDIPSLWFREQKNIVHIEEVLEGGNRLKSVTIYHRDKKTGTLLNSVHYTELLQKNAHWFPSQKGLSTFLDHDQNKAQVISYDGDVPIVATPRQIIDMTLKDVYYTPAQLWHAISGKSPSSLPPSNYLMAFFSVMFLPVQMAVMLLVAFPVTYIPPRAGLRNPLPVYVMAAGLGIVILQGMISALGNAGSLPIFLSVCSGPIIATLFSLAWILRLEER
ncbi:LptF/LptG family permease [Acetobacteraceae bacterium ESL0709]|nr:LptF/LptG family permease [Acetobacteraceae bacterium ESL0697]MDF7678189.1 LptF/LptG family permease [Acetobacteraceae bacterium ESL0709]